MLRKSKTLFRPTIVIYLHDIIEDCFGSQNGGMSCYVPCPSSGATLISLLRLSRPRWLPFVNALNDQKAMLSEQAFLLLGSGITRV